MSTYCRSKRTVTKNNFSVDKKRLIVPEKDLSYGKKVSIADKNKISMKRIDTNIRKKETNSGEKVITAHKIVIAEEKNDYLSQKS
jgi:hypothetical protein